MIWAVIKKTTDPVNNVQGLVRIKGSKHILGMQDFLYGFKQICSMVPGGISITECYILEVYNDHRIKEDIIEIDSVQLKDCVCYREVKEVQPNVLQVITHRVNASTNPTFLVGFTMDWNGNVYDASGNRTESRNLLPWLFANKSQLGEDYMSVRDVLTTCTESEVVDCKRIFTWLGRRHEYMDYITLETLNTEWYKLKPLWFSDNSHAVLGLDYKKPLYHRGKTSSSVRLALCVQQFDTPYEYFNYSDEQLLMYPKNSHSSDWHIRREGILDEVMEIKSKDEEFKQALLETEDRFLVYETTPLHDNVYGQCMCSQCRCNVGQNLLGKALMRLRNKLIT